jgi:quercetin dioxygenase-like cupin family protein
VYVTNVGNVVAREIGKVGAHKVKVKYLLHKGVGAERLQLRLFIVDVKGYTPFERHAHEHEVFMLRGRALVRGGGQEVKVESGDVIFIPSYELHQFKNIGEEPVEFLCTKETT